MAKFHNQKLVSVVNSITNIGYIVGCSCLYFIAIWIFGAAIWNIIDELLSDNFSIYRLLDEVAFIVFSIAVIDVCKYLMIEEVCKNSEVRKPFEVRKTLTKFVIIIVTAMALEGLVLTIQTAKSDVRNLFYPITLFLAAAIFLVCLGIYQRLNVMSEEISEK